MEGGWGWLPSGDLEEVTALSLCYLGDSCHHTLSGQEHAWGI